MICPQCKAEDKKSCVREGMGMTTAMYCAPYYDEDGKYHHHDYNSTTREYHCTNGHSWTERTSGKCWCGWSNN